MMYYDIQGESGYWVPINGNSSFHRPTFRYVGHSVPLAAGTVIAHISNERLEDTEKAIRVTLLSNGEDINGISVIHFGIGKRQPRKGWRGKA